jgi:hypothetical protein
MTTTELPLGSPRQAPAPPTCTDAPLWNVFLSRLHLPAVVVADQLGIVPFLARDAATPRLVADTFGLTHRGTEALLGVLAGLGLLRKVSGRFHPTEVAREYLMPNSPYYWGGIFVGFRSAPDRHSPEKLLQALRADPAARSARVTEDWENGRVPEGMARLITEHMHAHSFPSAVGLAQHVPVNGLHEVLDVGAGSGCFSIALALRCPEARFTLLDLPGVCEAAAEIVEQYGLRDRIGTHPANFFQDDWPVNCDAILLSNVLHDWQVERCAFLLARAFGSLKAGGRLLVHEMLLGDDGLGLAASAFSLQMAVGTLGSQFTADQLTELITSAGFVDVRYVHTFAYFWTAIAYKP